MDTGMPTVKELVLEWFSSRLDQLSLSDPIKDPKTRLQEYQQANKLSLPKYEVVKVTGATNEQLFTVACSVPEWPRSEEHTSELQLRPHLVCRLLLEKKNKKIQNSDATDDKKYRYKPDKIQTTRTTMTADTQSSFTSIYTSINPRQ